jgi:MFS family permease
VTAAEATDAASPGGRAPGLLRVAVAPGDFRRLLGAMTISQAGDWLYNVGLLVYIFNATHSAIWVAAGTVVRLLPYVVFGPFGGALADRRDRRRLMISSDLARAIIMALLALVATTSLTPAIALCLAGLATMAGTPYLPAVNATTPSVVPESDLAAANAAIQAIANIAIIAGPAIGGLLLLVGSPSVGFALNAVSFLGAAALVSRLSTRPQPKATVPQPDSSGIVAQIVDGYRALFSSGAAIVVVAIQLANCFVYGEMTVLLVLASQLRLGTGSEGYGYLLAALGLGGVLAVGFTSRLAARPRMGLMLAIALVVNAAPFGLLALIHQPVVAFVVLLVMGMGAIVVDVLVVTWLQRALPRELLGRVFGIFDSVCIGAMLAGALFAPLLVNLVGLDWALFIAGVGVPMLPLLGLPATRRMSAVAAEKAEEISPWVALLEKVEIFHAASRQSLELLAENATKLSIPAGETVIRQGDRAEHLYVILSGAFDVLFARGGEAAARVNELGVGDHFGEIGLLEHIARTATVVCAAQGQLLEIRGEDFLAAVTATPAISGTLLPVVTGRLARTHPQYQPRLATTSGPPAGQN